MLTKSTLPAAVALILSLLPGNGWGQSSSSSAPIARAESAWLELRNIHDELRMTRNMGLTVSPRGNSVVTLESRLARARKALTDLAAAVRQETLDSADLHAFGVLGESFAALQDPAPPPPASLPALDCRPGWDVSAGTRDTLAVLTAHVFACYGRAAQGLVVDGDTLDRLSIFGLLGQTDDAAKRQRLFMGLQPVWQSVNGDDAPTSLYRRMVAHRVKEWQGATPMVARARELGVGPDTLEQGLERILDAWRATLPDTVFEPWDFYYFNGEASRLLSPRVPKESFLTINRRYYRSLGADPDDLEVRYDIEPRPGKYPIAFTDIARRNPMRAWVSASYRIGGIDNLSELLHETGHAIHISAINTRPAYADWPDSDTFTEAVADLAALEMYEPAWQRRYLGVSAPLRASLRAKYSGIVMDIAWSLFEIRVHRFPERSPNQIWAEITRDYLKIRPHPEWSWWAMRGQLVQSPGYMLNYAFGAILIADLRARMATLRGPFTTGDSGWYRYVAPRLYRFGLAVPARDVVTQFLGRSVTVDALLADMARK
jgi:hypothetical protein